MARPTNAMWTDLAVNLVLLLMSDYVFVLAVSNCNYLIFNFLNLNAGWIHRMDNPDVHAPVALPDLDAGSRARCCRLRQCLPARGRGRCLGRRHPDGGLRLGRAGGARSFSTVTTSSTAATSPTHMN